VTTSRLKGSEGATYQRGLRGKRTPTFVSQSSTSLCTVSALAPRIARSSPSRSSAAAADGSSHSHEPPVAPWRRSHADTASTARVARAYAHPLVNEGRDRFRVVRPRQVDDQDGVRRVLTVAASLPCGLGNREARDGREKSQHDLPASDVLSTPTSRAGRLSPPTRSRTRRASCAAGSRARSASSPATRCPTSR